MSRLARCEATRHGALPSVNDCRRAPLALVAHRLTFQRLLLQVHVASDDYYRQVLFDREPASTETLYRRLCEAVVALSAHMASPHPMHTQGDSR